MHTIINEKNLKEGFLMRPPTSDEQPAILEVIQACSRKMTGTEEMTVENLQNDWVSPGFDPQTDLRVVTSPDGHIVGYIEAWTTAPIPVHPWIWGRVHPEFERQGIGTVMMDWAMTRVHSVLERVPEDARVSLYSGTISTYVPAKDFLAGKGLKLIRHNFRMRIEMDSTPKLPSWPDGITLRPFDGTEEQLKQIYLADEEAFEDHFGYVKEPFEDGFKRFKHFTLKDDAYDPTLLFVAMDGYEIAGVSLCHKWAWDEKEVGYVAGLSVRRPWRKQGLGLALLLHSFGEFWERGKKKVSLVVDGENLTGALRLYKKAGMLVHHQFDLYEKEIRPGKELSKMSLDE